MNYNYSINSIYINEYLYQIQHRIYNFKKKSKHQLQQETEIIIYQSWSIRKNLRRTNNFKKLKINNLKYRNLLKPNYLIKKQIQNLSYFTFLDFILLFELKKINNFTNLQVIKFYSLVVHSNFVFIKFCLSNSILFSLETLNIKEKLYYSIIKNYNLKSFKFLHEITQTKNNLVFFQDFSNFKLFIKKVLKKKVTWNKKQDPSQTKFFPESFNSFFGNSIFNVLIGSYFQTKEGKLIYKNETINRFFKNKNLKTTLGFKIQPNTKGSLQDCSNFGMNQCSLVNNSYKFVFVKKLEKSINLKSTDNFTLNNILNSCIKINNLHSSLSLFCNSKTQKINNFFSVLLENTQGIHFAKQIKIINAKLSSNVNFKNNYLNGIRNQLNLVILTKLENPYKTGYRVFLVKFKNQIVFLILDKYIILLQLKNLLVFLFLLKPILETKLSTSFYIGKKNISKDEILRFLLNKVTVSSKYFVQTISENFFNFQLNSYQLKTLTQKLDFASYLIPSRLKNFTFSAQSSSVYYNIGRQKSLIFLFFNILLQGFTKIVKNFSLVKNKKLNFLSLIVISNSKNMSSLEKKNFTNLVQSNDNSDLPEIFYCENQILILTETANRLAESLKLLKEFLYLQGSLNQFSKFKIGHTLWTYNKTKPGFDFLGFFIYQYIKLNSKNFNIKNKKFMKIIKLLKPMFSSNELLEKPRIQITKLVSSDRLLNINTKNNKQLIITTINPAKTKILIHLQQLKKIIKMATASTQEDLIIKLSIPIRIWAYYYNTNYNNKFLNYCDYLLFKILWRWSCRRHPKKNKKWIKYKYFYQLNGKNWIFGIYKTDDFSVVCLPNHSDIQFLKPPALYQ